MRYAADHKAQARQRIVASAARRFRLDGYEATALGDIMSDVGLTVGGFYAHFGSKEELFAEAIAVAGRQALLDRTPDPEPEGPQWVGAFVAGYLSRTHLDDRADGCPIAALSGDVTRAGALPRSSYRDGVDCFIDVLTAHLDGPPEQRRPTALAVMSLCVGALSIARAGLAPAASEALFEACRKAAEQLVRGDSRQL
ncbi:MAG TPA: TetR/AcrR family transcriptional regulator [Sporichthyaceae bacterium]|jgi:TetR/AcrR family transcriptional repressor of nem operon|nr:TetR/AcrR family transcriptional regulator [Sporichthyaceae bacterium]